MIPEWLDPKNWDEETKQAAINAGKTILAFVVLVATKKTLDTHAEEIIRLPVKTGPYAK